MPRRRITGGGPDHRELAQRPTGASQPGTPLIRISYSTPPHTSAPPSLPSSPSSSWRAARPSLLCSIEDCFCAMSWRIPLFGSQQQQQQPEPNFPNISTQSWYPPSVGGSSSLPSTPSSSGASPHQRASDHPQPSSRGQPSPAEAAGIIARLRDRSVDELQRLLKDKESYNAFFNSLDQVKTQNNLRDELRKETLQLARENLEKEQRILELRNQCTIIRTTELAAAEDRLAELERQKDEIMKSYSPAALLDKLQSTMAKLDEESEELHQKFLEKDVDLPTFVQKYKKLRAAHHKCALLNLSGKASLR
ncbi:hypothetical protein ZWY2020_034311 [Hordeum vulgare]|nr:hypothetical protein ZWY2020_034311 [Hordeum vulgare]